MLPGATPAGALPTCCVAMLPSALENAESGGAWRVGLEPSANGGGDGAEATIGGGVERLSGA